MDFLLHFPLTFAPVFSPSRALELSTLGRRSLSAGTSPSFSSLGRRSSFNDVAFNTEGVTHMKYVSHSAACCGFLCNFLRSCDCYRDWLRIGFQSSTACYIVSHIRDWCGRSIAITPIIRLDPHCRLLVCWQSGAIKWPAHFN